MRKSNDPRPRTGMSLVGETNEFYELL